MLQMLALYFGKLTNKWLIETESKDHYGASIISSGKKGPRSLILGLKSMRDLYFREFSALIITMCLFFEKKIIASGPLGPSVIFSDKILHTIKLLFQIENFLGPQNTKCDLP